MHFYHQKGREEMAAKTVQSIVDKWVRNSQAGTESAKLAVEAVTENPCALAAAKKAEYVSGVIAAKDKWEDRLRQVTLQDWKKAMLSKGIPRMAQGIADAKPKMTKFMNEFMPFVTNAAAEVRAMPKGTLEQGIARMTAMVRKLAEFRKK